MSVATLLNKLPKLAKKISLLILLWRKVLEHMKLMMTKRLDRIEIGDVVRSTISTASISLVVSAVMFESPANEELRAKRV